jgi:hypothetical protein
MINYSHNPSYDCMADTTRNDNLPETRAMPRSLHLPFVVLLASLLVGRPTLADGPKDNLPERVRPVPPLGIELPAADRAELQRGLKDLDAAIAILNERPDPRTRQLLADVEIFARAAST